MSAPIQNVYFYNPTTITTLQEQVAALQNQVGFGQQLSTNTASYLTTGAYNLQNRAPVYFGTGGSLDLYATDFANPYGGHPGYGVLGGNLKTGEEYFGTSNRPVNGNGDLWNATGTMYNFGSTGKLLTGLVCAKMIEEGIVDPSESCSIYYNVMTGTGYYYDTVTVSSGTAFPYNPSSYTATTGSFDWTTITISDLIHFNIGLLDDFFTLPCAGINFPSSISSVITNANSNSAGLATLLQYNTLMTSLLLGTPFGPAAQVYNGNTSFLTTSSVDNYINLTKSAGSTSTSLPLSFKPRSYKNDVLPFNVRAQLSTYDFSYVLLGIVLDKALKAKSVSASFADYARDKFFTPLGMDDTYTLYQDTIPSGKFSRLADSSFRRSPLVGACNYFYNPQVPLTGTINPIGDSIPDYATYVFLLNGGAGDALQSVAVSAWPLVTNSIGCSPSYSTGAINQLVGAYPAGPLVTLGFTAAQLVWTRSKADDGISKVTKGGFYYTGAGSSSNYPTANSPIISTLKDYSELLKLVGNRGVSSNGTRLIKTETWNYLVSSKINAFSLVNDGGVPVTYGDSAYESPSNDAYCMGFYRTNRDISNNTLYGFDESTLFNGGVTGNIIYIDFYTGNWFVAATPELGLSSGTFDAAGGSAVVSKTLIPGVLKQLIKD